MCTILFAGIFLNPFLLSSVEASCFVANRESGTSCTYTVVCTTFAGSVNNPGCNGTPNVTFFVQNSTVDSLTNGFFSATNFDSRVRKFVAYRNDWKFIESNALKYYRFSTTVNMISNKIQIIEDGAFTDLTSMTFLNLSGNDILYLRNKTLHTSDISTNALIKLDLSNNSLKSLESNVFSLCQYLEELYLQNNHIEILSDTCFNNLKNLKKLVIRNNNIPSINMSLAIMTELTFIDISYNRIKQLYGYELIRLISLKHLNMSHNDIEAIDHNTFAQVVNLRVLDLSYNKIYSILAKDLFVNNHVLSYVDFYQNNVTTLDPMVFRNNNLQFINVENNNITGEIASDTFRGLSNITELNITNQQITAIKNNAFSDMKNLKHLNLSCNVIKIIENSSFVNTSSLIVLDLSRNQIESLNFMKSFTSNLTEAYLNNNNISSLPERLFENHSNLKRLDISKNFIVRIDPNALPLNSLQFFDMNYNNLSGTVVAKVFSPAKLLRYLDLSNFHLKKINESALIDLPLAARVNISYNDIEYIHPSNFKGVENMYSLDISHNNLTNLAIDAKLNKLKAIYLMNNNFIGIPNIFSNDSELDYINLSHNKISHVIDPVFKNISRVRVLNLSYNCISHFNNEYTNALTNLAELSLGSNQIKDMINMSYFNHLQSVNISDNQIAYVNSSHFLSQRTLQLLSLSGNHLKILDPGTFQNLQHLLLLDLSSNEIKNIRFGTFRGLTEIEILNLSQNKIQFLNSEVFHECSALKTLIIDYNNISSIDVEKIETINPKLSFLSLGGNPIACEEILRNNRSISRNLAITSLHKVYHEDNVHGIKCGIHANNSLSIESTTVKPTTVDSETIALTIWCAVLTVLVIVGIALYVYKRHSKRLTVNRESRMQFQHSEMGHSECYSDLLN